MQIGIFMTVLLVDDHKGIRDLEKSLFASLFDAFYESSSGEEAIKMYKAHKPDWVFMDYKMNGITGVEAVKKIKENDSCAKIIMVTQYENNDLRKAALNAGAAAYILKENLPEIQNIINNYKVF
jgi:CheY-like chemotaxis protein